MKNIFSFLVQSKYLLRAQTYLFVILWAVTMLPHLLTLQNIALVLGATIGIFKIVKNLSIFRSHKVIPIFLVALIFIWATIHLLWIGENPQLQWIEYTSFWKRAFLGSLFAIGLGISIAESDSREDKKVIFIGLLLPTIIYYFKLFLMTVASIGSFTLPEFLNLYSNNISSYYVPKISYVFYCLPVLAVSFGLLAENLKRESKSWQQNIFLITVIIAVLGIFYLENIKNGFIYSLLFTLIFLLTAIRGGLKTLSVKGWLPLLTVFFIVFGFAINNIRSNSSWINFFADYEIAAHVSPSEAWSTTFQYPLNKYGQIVAQTNFDRVFYLHTAVSFVRQYPLGYGLIDRSFGHIATHQYPNAPLIQSHSGWMDLILAIGIPGALLLLFAALSAILMAKKITTCFWRIFGRWSLGSIVLLLLTTEAAQKNYIDTLIWLICLVATLAISKKMP